MRFLASFLLFFYYVAPLAGQLQNTGFELSRDSIPYIPEKWKVSSIDTAHFKLDETQHLTGNYSLRLRLDEGADHDQSISFSQLMPSHPDRLQKVRISFFVKTQKFSGETGIWVQGWNHHDEQVVYANSNAQAKVLPGSEDWKEYSFSLLVDTSIREITVGGFLKGAGAVWFDDIRLDTGLILKGKTSRRVNEFKNQLIRAIRDFTCFNDSLNWPQLEMELGILVTGMRSINETHALTAHMISALKKAGDKHSFVQDGATSRKYATTNLDVRHPRSEFLEPDIGYLYVPGFKSTDAVTMRRFAGDIQKQIRDLDAVQHVRRWIVDLRENTGGNMYPMIAGLGPLLDTGVLGYFVSRGQWLAWYFRNGGSGSNGRVLLQMENSYQLRDKPLGIAVLVGPKTGSSGEMTAISFAGQENVRFFGMPSGGFTTGNTSHRLSNGTVLYVASSRVADRSRRMIWSQFVPDELVRDEQQLITIAKEWLDGL